MQVGFLGLTSLLEFIDLSKSHLDGQLGVSLLTVLRRRVSRCDCLEEEGLSLLFSSILKRLQSEVSQHVGDTSRGAVFVILVDEASCTSLDVF